VAVTMTWVGLDVHARSVEASVVDSATGELRRRRVSGSEVGPLVDWLEGLPGPVRACYEAGPTGYGLARAAREAGIAMEVIASRASADGRRAHGDPGADTQRGGRA
jgi:transposase